MTRSAALRAGMIFVLLSVIFGALGASTYSPVAEALLAVTASLCAVMLMFAAATPAYVPVPVRRRRR